MFAYEKDLCKIQERLNDIVSFVDEHAASGDRIDTVERELFSQLLELGLQLLQRFVEAAGDGDVGETVEKHGQVLRRIEMRKRVYRSIFGVLEFKRMIYAVRKGQRAYSPVEEAMSLPEGEQSYVLQDWLQRFSVQNPFDSSAQSLRVW